MDIDITAYAIYGLPALALVTSIVGVAKKAGLSTKWAPILSLGIGILTGIAFSISSGEPILAGISIGILLGAAACGVYDLGKSATGIDSDTIPNDSDNAAG